MISKKILCKRLSTALGQDIESKFTWFFGYFCERKNREDLRQVQQLEMDDVMAFSQFCGYDLRFPIPLPLIVKF
jgi:hypothetical protein